MKNLLKLLLNRTIETMENDKTKNCHSSEELHKEEDRLIKDDLHTESNRLMIPFGLCAVISKMSDDRDINLTKSLKLRGYLNKHRPKSLRSDLNNIVSIQRYYWLPGNWTARIKWIEKHIELN